MATYYYFAATLPALSMEGPLPMTWEAFVAMAETHLIPSDLEAVRRLAEPPDEPAEHPFVNAWRDKELQLRNEVVHVRANRARRDALPFLRDTQGCDVAIVKGVSDAFAQDDPLQREHRLDALRWALLDELAGYEPFGSDAVLAYALKLRLVARWAGIEKEAGRRKADSIVNQNVDIAS